MSVIWLLVALYTLYLEVSYSRQRLELSGVEVKQLHALD